MEKHKKMMNTIFEDTIMMDKLKDLGFKYNMGIWHRNGFSLQFYRYCWKCSVVGMPEFELIYMKDLYLKFWELTGKVLPPLK